MARRLHEAIALDWLELTRQREGRSEAEANFRRWIRRQTDKGYELDHCQEVLEAALRCEPRPCWRFSRELLEDVGELPQLAVDRVPDETPEQRRRRKARTAAFLGPRAVAVPDRVEDELAAAAERAAEREQAEAELEDGDRLSPDELDELGGLRG